MTPATIGGDVWSGGSCDGIHILIDGLVEFIDEDVVMIPADLMLGHPERLVPVPRRDLHHGDLQGGAGNRTVLDEGVPWGGLPGRGGRILAICRIGRKQDRDDDICCREVKTGE